MKSVVGILNIFTTPSVKYVIIRYFTYAIQFVNTIFLLRFLGEYKYGVYSFILLFFSYFTYVNLGLNYSLNTLLSIYKKRTTLLQGIWSVCCMLNLVFSAVVVLANVLIINLFPDLFNKYDYADYALWIMLIGLLININLSYVSVYRIYGKLQKINFQQSMPNLLLFAVMLILRNKLTIHEILYVLAGAQVVSLLMFMYKSPLAINLTYHRVLAIILVKRGVHLMLQSFSFNFITIAATTLVGAFYVAEDLGFYSLSNTVVNAIVLALGAFMFLLYPKMLNRFANGSALEIDQLLKRVRDVYILGADFIALLSLLCIPFASFFVPQYNSMFECFKILTIAQMIFNGTMGYSQLLIARKLEQKMTIYGLLSVCVVLGCSLLIGFVKLSYYYMPFAVVAGILLYSFLILNKGISCIKEVTPKNVLKELFNLPKVASVFVILISFFLRDNYITPVLAFLIMFFMTRNKIVNMIEDAVSILSNKELLKI